MAGNTDNSTPATTIDFSNLSSMKLPGGVVFAPSGVTGLSAGAPVYNAAGVLQTGAHTVEDTVITNASNPGVLVTLTGAAVFTSATSYKVVATVVGGNALVQVNQISGTQFTLTAFNNAGGAANFAVNFMAVGT